MAPPTIPVGVPASLVAGDSVTWDNLGFTTARYGSFSSTAGYALATILVGPAVGLTVAGTPEGSGWRTSLTPAQTLCLVDSSGAPSPSRVSWLQRVTLAADTFTVASGVLLAFADPAQLDGGSVSENATMLATVKAAIKDVVTLGMSAFQIQGRAVTLHDLGALLKLQAFYTAAVAQEQSPGQLGRAVAARFLAPGGLESDGWR